MGAKAVFDADFGKFIGELSKVDVKLREFGPEVDKTSKKMQSLADSLNGNKIREQAGIAVAAISKLEGGVAALNAGELKRYGALIDAATEKLVRQGKDVPPALAQVKAALDQARKPLEDINKAASETSGAFSNLAGAIGQGLGIGAGLGVFGLVSSAVSGLKDQIVATITEGNKLSQLRTAFESLQGGSGNAAVAIGNLRSATRGLVSDVDLLAASNKASLLGLNDMGIKTDELASVAVRLGKAMGQDAAKSVDDLTTALARQSPMILDNLGIKVNLTEANEKYAAGIGKSVSALTDEEKKLAFATTAMDAAKAKADILGEAQLTLSEQIARVGNALTNTQSGFGAMINESTLLSGAVGAVAGRIDELVTSVGKLGPAFNVALGPLATFVSRFAQLPSVSKDVADGFGLILLPALGAVNLAIQGVTRTLERYGQVRQYVFGADTATTGPKRSADIKLKTPVAESSAGLVKAHDDGINKLSQAVQRGNDKLAQLAQARTERLNRLTGRDVLVAAQQTVKDLDAIGGAAALSPAQTSRVFSQLFEAREIARVLQPSLVGGLTAAMSAVSNSPVIRAEAKEAGAKIFRALVDPSELRKVLAGAGTTALIGRELERALSPLPDAMRPAIADSYELAKGLRGIGIPLDTVIERFDKVTAKTTNWRESLRNVSQAFANLSQISGGALDGFTTSLGVVLGAADAATSAVQALADLFKSEKFAGSAGGKLLAGGLAGLAAGPQFAQLAGANDGKGAFLAGAVGGGVSGFAAGGPYGAVAGAAIGGISAMLAQRAQEKALRLEMDRNRESLLANFESREDLIRQAGRVGLSESYIRSQILDNTTSAQAYTTAVNKLNAAFANENREAVALSKSLGAVAKVNGVLSLQQTRDLRNALVVSPSRSPFPDGRTGPGDGGRIAQPREGVTPIGDGGGLAIDGPKKEAAEAFLRQQGESLLAGLGKILEQPGALTPSLVRAVGQSLPAALAELERSGLSSIDALKTLQPLLEKFQEKAVLAGAGSTPGFDALNQQLALLKDERLGPLIERANGAGQALGALQNLGLLNAETFAGFTASITETVAGMDLLSTDGQNAMRLIRQPLQNIWQLQKDFGYEVDASTQALLDQAEAAGLIGEKFRPVEDRMLEGIDKIVDRLDKLIGVFTGEFPAAAIEGAQIASAGIRGEFDRLKPVVRVRYQVDDPPPIADPRVFYPEDPRRNEPPSTQPSEPTLPTPTEPGTRHPADSGFAAAQSATSSTQTAAVYIDGREAGYAILPHLGSILEFHDVR